MSLNNIQMEPSMLANLYHNNLIETKTTFVPETKPLGYFGNNQKNVLVIVSNNSFPYLPDHELNFLTNVLAACKLSIADIGIINLYRTQIEELMPLIDSDAKTVLLFGLSPLSIELPINFPSFQLQQFNKRTYLHAPTLSEIENDKGLKLKLWNALKTLFGI